MGGSETNLSRRSALTSLGTAATVGLAGCLGYTIESEDDVEGRKTRIDELESEIEDLESNLSDREDEIADLESQIQDRESQIEDLESDVSDREDEIESLESDLETLRAEKVSALYTVGHARTEASKLSKENANAEADKENYDLASLYWVRAEGELNGAHTSFDEAQSVADEEGFSSVASTIEEARMWAKHMSQACLNMANAYLFLSRGQDSMGQDYADMAQEAFKKADQYDVADPSDIESQLGL